MDAGKKVWAPHFDEGFILGEICDFGTDTLSVQPLDGGKVSAVAAPGVKRQGPRAKGG